MASIRILVSIVSTGVDELKNDFQLSQFIAFEIFVHAVMHNHLPIVCMLIKMNENQSTGNGLKIHRIII